MGRMAELAAEQEQLEQWQAEQDAAYHQSMLEAQQEVSELIDSLEASEAITRNEASLLRWSAGVQKVESKEQPQIEMAVTTGDPLF